MSETAKIVFTACITLGGGAILFCATTVVNKLLIEPVLTVRKTLGDISYCLQYHAWVFHTDAPKERMEKVFDDLRSFPARLRADANAIIGYRFFVAMGWLPNYDDLLEGSGRLIRLSNTLGSPEWDQINADLKAVESLLRVDIGRPQYRRQ